MSELASLPWLRCSLTAGADQLLVMHNVAAMVDIERAAFFAARTWRAEMSQLPIGHCLGACPLSIVFSSAPPAGHLAALRVAHVLREMNPTVVRFTGERLSSVSVVSGHHAFELRAVLGAVQGSSLRSAHASIRAWPSGLDGACAQLADGNCVMASSSVCSGRQTMPVSGNRSQVRSWECSPAALDAAIRLLETGTDTSRVAVEK